MNLNHSQQKLMSAITLQWGAHVYYSFSAIWSFFYYFGR